MQAVQTSGVPTLPTAPSLWRSVGFPSGVSRLFNQPRKHRAHGMKASLCSPVLFLCARQDVPFFPALEQTVHCCEGSNGEVDAVAGKMKAHQLKCLSKCCFVFPQLPVFFNLVSSKLVRFRCLVHYYLMYCSPLSTISNRWCFFVTHYLSPDASKFCAMKQDQ